MTAHAPRQELKTPTLTAAYTPPPGLRAVARPPFQHRQGLLFRHVLLAGNENVGMVAVVPVANEGNKLSNDTFLTVVPIEGEGHAIAKTEGSNRSRHPSWDALCCVVDFALEGAPRAATIHLFSIGGPAKASTLVVSLWGNDGNAQAAAQIMAELSLEKRLHPARRNGLLHLTAGATVLLAGLVLSGVTYHFAQTQSLTSGAAQEYAVFIGLILVGAFIMRQGL